MSELCMIRVILWQGSSGRANKEGVQEGSVAPAGRKTLETLGAADSITEALEMAANEQKRHEVLLVSCSHRAHQHWPRRILLCQRNLPCVWHDARTYILPFDLKCAM